MSCARASWLDGPALSRFAWVNALTKIGPEGVSDALYERARAHFSEVQLSELSFTVGVIDLWNRPNIDFRNPPGSTDEMLGLTKAGLK